MYLISFLLKHRILHKETIRIKVFSLRFVPAGAHVGFDDVSGGIRYLPHEVFNPGKSLCEGGGGGLIVFKGSAANQSQVFLSDRICRMPIFGGGSDHLIVPLACPPDLLPTSPNWAIQNVSCTFATVWARGSEVRDPTDVQMVLSGGTMETTVFP